MRGFLPAGEGGRGAARAGEGDHPVPDRRRGRARQVPAHLPDRIQHTGLNLHGRRMGPQGGPQAGQFLLQQGIRRGGGFAGAQGRHGGHHAGKHVYCGECPGRFRAEGLQLRLQRGPGPCQSRTGCADGLQDRRCQVCGGGQGPPVPSGILQTGRQTAQGIPLGGEPGVRREGAVHAPQRLRGGVAVQVGHQVGRGDFRVMGH